MTAFPWSLRIARARAAARKRNLDDQRAREEEERRMRFIDRMAALEPEERRKTLKALAEAEKIRREYKPDWSGVQ